MSNIADPSYNVPWEELVAGTPDAVIYADREGTIRVWNDGAAAVFGFSAAEALGQNLDLIIPERLRAAHWAGFDRAMETGKTKGGAEVRVTRGLHKDGRRLYVEMSFGVAVDAKTGKAIGSVAMARDGTERYLASRAAAMAAPAASTPSSVPPAAA
ncbi:MAG: PAS domain S-box protein [Burkholderiales bacterium]|nr:PAS domain S-box protein [Burkholderiales bacterium]